MDKELDRMCEEISKYLREKYHFGVKVTIDRTCYEVVYAQRTFRGNAKEWLAESNILHP